MRGTHDTPDRSPCDVGLKSRLILRPPLQSPLAKLLPALAMCGDQLLERFRIRHQVAGFLVSRDEVPDLVNVSPSGPEARLSD